MVTKGINLSGVPQAAVRVLTSPAAFFGEMPKRGGFLEPLVFMVVMGLVAGIIQAVLSIIGLGLNMGVAAGLGAIILVPLMVALFGFVVAGILYGIWMLMGSRESYETAYRCGAYASVLVPLYSVLGMIPYAGAAIGVALGTFFIVTASVEVHKIRSQKAWLVFGVIGAVLILIMVSSQLAARKFTKDTMKFQKQMEETSKAMQKQAEEMQKQAGDARKAAEEMQQQKQ